MSQPYIGEVRLVGFSFAPAGWSLCQGQTVPISENDTLFNLIGTTYGGDGQETFQLPNLAGRVPIHNGTGPSGNTYVIGEMAGVEQVTLTGNQIPQHSHLLLVSSDIQGNVASPNNNFVAAGQNMFRNTPPAVPMAAGMVGPVGGNQPHENMQPFLVLSWIISLFGIYPTPT